MMPHSREFHKEMSFIHSIQPRIVLMIYINNEYSVESNPICLQFREKPGILSGKGIHEKS